MAGAGTATLDFGAFPGKADASVAVTGQTAIAAGSLVEAWIRPADTADHLAGEHVVENIRVVAADIIAGTGFTIYGLATTPEMDRQGDARAPGLGFGKSAAGGVRLYGQWSVAWAWY